MRAPLSWIKDFTDIQESPGDIAEAFNQLGIEVEGFTVPADKISGVRIAKILNIEDHPNSDHLHLVDIDLGGEQTRVVCGAQNLVVGMVAPYAGIGADLDGFQIEKRKIRGVESLGMLCSERELGLSAGHDGIMNLPASFALGSDFRDAIGTNEAIFDLAITPNRPDAMCIVGLARELSAHFGRDFNIPEPTIKGGYKTANPVIDIRDPERNPRYMGWRANVKVGPSPDWLAWRLSLAGLRPISNVVDVTNYVLLERNQPTHAFDANKIRNGVIVRRAEKGEVITTLDGVERTLSTEELLICDANDRPQAIAGIMGGLDSSISEETTELLLEVAYFSNIGISISSKRLGLRSDSSARYERGIDPNGTEQSGKRVMQLLEEVADAKVADKPVDKYPNRISEQVVTVRTSRVNKILGTSLTSDQVHKAINPLGLRTKGKGEDFEVTVPTYRPDIEREIDVIEEVGRRVGYQNIQATLPNYSAKQGRLTQTQQDVRVLTEVLVGGGINEAKAFPLVAPEDLAAFKVSAKELTEVSNPLRKDESVLASTLLPGLLKSVAYNLRQGTTNVALFELDNVFLQSSELLPNEERNLAVVITGAIDERPAGAIRNTDVFDITRVLDNIREQFAFTNLSVDQEPALGFVNGKCAQVTIDGKPCGTIGELDPKVLKHFGIENPVFALEVSTDVLLKGVRSPRQFREPSTFPPAYFDLAFELPQNVPAKKVVSVITEAGGELIESVRVFDLYKGEQVDAGNVSLALSITLRAKDRTLNDNEVQSVRKSCIDAARVHCEAIIRGE